MVEAKRTEQATQAETKLEMKTKKVLTFPLRTLIISSMAFLLAGLGAGYFIQKSNMDDRLEIESIFNIDNVIVSIDELNTKDGNYIKAPITPDGEKIATIYVRPDNLLLPKKYVEMLIKATPINLTSNKFNF